MFRQQLHAGLTVCFDGGGAIDADIFKVICATSRWVDWTKFGQEFCPKESVMQRLWHSGLGC